MEKWEIRGGGRLGRKQPEQRAGDHQDQKGAAAGPSRAGRGLSLGSWEGLWRVALSGGGVGGRWGAAWQVLMLLTDRWRNWWWEAGRTRICKQQ